VALTKIGFTLIKDNFKDAVSGSSTAHSSSFSTRVTTAETELGNTLLSGSAQISSNISGSLGANATVIRNLSAPIISGSSVSSSDSVSARVVSLEGSGTIQGVGTTDDVLFANITGSSVSASVGDFTTVNIDGGDINVSNLNSTNITGSVVSSSTALFTTATIDKIGGAIDFNNENMTNVDIDSGTITGITDLTVADGGTGVSTFTDGGVLLGSGTSAITAMAVLTDGQMIVGDGTTDPVAESGATLRTSIGVGTTNDVKFTNITGSNNISASGNLSITGNVDVDGTSNFAGDVTLQNDLVVTGRIDAEEIHTTFISSSIAQATGSTIFGDATSDSHQFTGSVDVSGSFTVRDGNVVVSDTLTATNIGAFTATGAIDFDNQNMTNVDIDSGVITGITDITVADGGTGVSTLTDGGVLLGNGAGAIQAMAVLTDGQMIVGDGTTDPVAESGATLRTSIGVGTTDDVKFANITGSNNISASGNLLITGNISGSSNLGADGDLYIGGRITGSGLAVFGDNVEVTGNVTASGDLGTAGDLYVGGKITGSGLAVFGGNVTASGDLGTTKDLYVGGRITGSSGATFVGNVGIGTTGGNPLGMTRDLTINGTADISLTLIATNNLGDNTRGTQVNFCQGSSSLAVASIQAAQVGVTDGALASADLVFGTKVSGQAGGQPDEKMRIQADGKVGIGTVSPSQLLNVEAADGVSDNTWVTWLQNKEATDDRNYGLRISAGSTASDTAFFVQDHDASNDYFIIRGNGKVGIGTTSPDYLVEIEKANGDHTSTALSITNSQAGGYGSVLNFVSQRSDSTAHAVAASIRTQGEAAWDSDANTDSNLFFSTVLDNTLADKMKLNAAGNLDIGGRAYNSSTGGFYMNDGRIQNTITANSSGYEVMMFDNTTENGTVALLQYRTNAAAEGSIIADGSGLAISNNSDYRKKERITDLEGSLDAINSLQPRKYYYRKEFAKPRRAFAGFIAHEVQESQLPHLTTGVKDGVVTQEDLDNDLHSEKIVGDPAYQTVSYSGNEMITRLVGAVQELSEKVEAQQKEIEELKN